MFRKHRHSPPPAADDESPPPPPEPPPAPVLDLDALRAEAVAEVLVTASGVADEIVGCCEDAKASAEDMRDALDGTSRSVGSLMERMGTSRGEIASIREASTERASVAVGRMLDIGEEIRVSTGQVETLVEALGGLTQFVATIESISEETNILSLNARIEAARAGDHGRGFAVVAEQVKALAARSSEQAAHVRELIAALGAQARATAGTIVESVGRLDEIKRELDRLHDEQGVSWEAVGGEIEAMTHRLRDVQTAMQQQAAASVRTGEDIAAVVERTERVRRLDWVESTRGDLLAEVRARGVLRVGAWTGFRGLNFVNPRTRTREGMELELLELVGRELGVRIEVGDDPWIDLPKRLRRGDFDLLFCALIPSPEYRGIAYTRSYLDMGLVIMRRTGDERIRDLADLAGKVVGHIADPAAEASLAETGLAFGSLRPVYDDDYYQPVVDGVYDAFAIDLPIVHWCATSPDSPWYGQLEVVGKPFTRWIYSAATRADDASAPLLAEVDRIVGKLRRSPEYERIVRRWQGGVHDWALGPGDFLTSG